MVWAGVSKAASVTSHRRQPLQLTCASHVTTKLDSFVSHSWNSVCSQQMLTMWLMHNSVAAWVSSLVVGLLAAVLQLDAVALLPKPRVRPAGAGPGSTVEPGVWCSVLSPCTFVMTLACWQEVRRLVGFRVPLVFLDRLCIDQIHEDRKIAGVQVWGPS